MAGTRAVGGGARFPPSRAGRLRSRRGRSVAGRPAPGPRCRGSPGARGCACEEGTLLCGRKVAAVPALTARLGVKKRFSLEKRAPPLAGRRAEKRGGEAVGGQEPTKQRTCLVALGAGRSRVGL